MMLTGTMLAGTTLTGTTLTGTTALAAHPTLADFGHDPLWITLVKAVALFLFLALGVVFGVWFERKLISRMQHRHGPNRAGTFGLLQSVADAIKMGLKEDIFPRTVDKVLYLLAPVIMVVPAFLAFSIVPFGPVVNLFGVETPL
ncbi:NADH-quinone oxidoreductase subunit H, partial [Nonomuraea candida]|uniref:NADH-quinone oxidoreductase subunit H n=1 Tax=Nonomuraea candida TaxID=359159 RepID=UPI0005BA4DF2